MKDIAWLCLLLIALLSPLPVFGQEESLEENVPFQETLYCENDQLWTTRESGTPDLVEDCASLGQLCQNQSCIAGEAEINNEAETNSEVEEKTSQSPTASASSSANNSSTGGKSSHETALERLTRATTPVIPKPVEENVFSRFLNLLPDIFGFKVALVGLFTSRAGIQNSAEIPPIPEPENINPIEKAAKDLGGKTGVYSVTVPEAAYPAVKNTDKFEDVYSKANYPPGINPFK